MQRPYPNDPRLTGIAIAFRNGALIADREKLLNRHIAQRRALFARCMAGS